MSGCLGFKLFGVVSLSCCVEISENASMLSPSSQTIYRLWCLRVFALKAPDGGRASSLLHFPIPKRVASLRIQGSKERGEMERGQQCFYLGQIRLRVLMPARRPPEFPCCCGAAISLHRGASIERKKEKERKRERDRKTESARRGRKDGRGVDGDVTRAKPITFAARFERWRRRAIMASLSRRHGQRAGWTKGRKG